jgi:hypothetical protein
MTVQHHRPWGTCGGTVFEAEVLDTTLVSDTGPSAGPGSGAGTSPT